MNTQENNSFDDFWGEPISSYTRAQALEDGFLIDVSHDARALGFKYPVAITSAAWHATTCEEEHVALIALLNALRSAIKAGGSGDTVHFATRGIKLKSICGPGDTAAPVITILLPDED